jgi:predicted nucleic acid-binding protein
MQGNPLRVVIDTNIWISFLIGKSLTGLSETIINGQIRPKFKKYFSETAIEDLVSLLYEKVELIEITKHFEDCRDEKDDFLLDLAVSGHANYLVTGDADLLILNPFQGVEIISYQSFQNQILK